MKAVVLEEINQITVREVEDPEELGIGELLIAPRMVGICGSDVHYYRHGRIGDFVLKAPMILGHEASGVIIGVGAGVTGFSVGDRVAMEPGVPNLNSKASRIGMYNVDPDVRFWATPPVDGCLAEKVMHPAEFTYHLPPQVGFEEGALLEPLAVGVHAATKAQIHPGDIAAVAGCGTVGMLTAAAALAGGASKVFVSDVSSTKLEIAAGIPGIVPVDLKSQSLEEAVMHETSGWGANVVFEASGSLESYKTLWRIGAPGNCTVLIGMPVDSVPLDVVAVQSRETRIESVFRYANVYQRAIDLVASGKINLKPFISKIFPFSDAVDAFERVAEGRPEDVKVQIAMNQDLALAASK
ncbi:NAD(P)-dependent alcohol dehydrogenase [Changpingibacter yushuensis]|uniref:NAD(P)-dependent alcohol dehydrogenase n=1 Tax=Changpingibacter yushuensis TaxID=2758440 RepID=UPI00165DC402|nr:NAD(P)-dependent alcohol dehydrogenase [Changpingibacter yushuensis]